MTPNEGWLPSIIPSRMQQTPTIDLTMPNDDDHDQKMPEISVDVIDDDEK